MLKAGREGIKATSSDQRHTPGMVLQRVNACLDQSALASRVPLDPVLMESQVLRGSQICAPLWTTSAGARSATSTCASPPWSATSCSRLSSATRPPAGRRARSRRTCATPATGSGNRCPPSPTWRASMRGCRSAVRPCGTRSSTVRSRHCWAQERASLMPVSRPFDGFVEHTKRVSPTCLIHFERNRYSVPASFANRPVSLRVYADRLVAAA